MLLIDDAGTSELYILWGCRRSTDSRFQWRCYILNSSKKNSIMFSIVQCYCDKKICLVSYYVICMVSERPYLLWNGVATDSYFWLPSQGPSLEKEWWHRGLFIWRVSCFARTLSNKSLRQELGWSFAYFKKAIVLHKNFHKNLCLFWEINIKNNNSFVKLSRLFFI